MTPRRFLANCRTVFVRGRWLLVSTILLGTVCCGVLRFQHSADYSKSPLLCDPPPQWPDAKSLRIVTYNIKDMYFLSTHRPERMRAIAGELRRLRADVVCLQEAFVAGDLDLIRADLRDAGLVHAMDFPAGVVGSGLAMISRYPIREVFFAAFSKNGAFHDTKGGDWWAGKGVALSRIELAPGFLLDIYNTHMICGLGPKELSDHRHVQVRELASFIASASPENIPALIAGDFNCRSQSREFLYICGVLRWHPLVLGGIDHIAGWSLHDRYSFTVQEKAVIDGKVAIPGDPPHEVDFSDHRGYLVEVMIAPNR